MSETSEAQESRWDWLKVWGPLLLLVVAGFAFAFSRLEPPPPKQFRMATGSVGGAYFAFAERYREILQEEGYTLEVIETTGSLENLELLHRGEVDLALLQGGTGDDGGENTQHLKSLGSLYFEPLWVFHRASLEVSQLRDLTGMRLAVGPEQSGTRALAEDLLAANGIHEGTAEISPLGGNEAASALLDGEVDVAFFVTSARAEYVRKLSGEEEVRLLSISRYLAYSTNFRFLSPVVLGEGTLDLAVNVPPEDVTLLASAASLVSRQDLHHALIPLLLQTTKSVHSEGGVFEQPGQFPSADFTELPMSKEAQHYIENGPSFLYEILPFRYAVLIDRLKILLLPFITLLFPVLKAAPPLYRYRIRRRIFRWYEDLKQVDEILRVHQPSQEELEVHLGEVRRMEREVTEVQVPLSYMDEFYRLRIHIALILAKLRRLGEQLENSPRA